MIMVELRNKVTFRSSSSNSDANKINDAVKVRIHVREYKDKERQMTIKQQTQSVDGEQQLTKPSKKITFCNGKMISDVEERIPAYNRSDHFPSNKHKRASFDYNNFQMADDVDVEEYDSMPPSPTFVNVLYIDMLQPSSEDNIISVRTVGGKDGKVITATGIFNVE